MSMHDASKSSIQLILPSMLQWFGQTTETMMNTPTALHKRLLLTTVQPIIDYYSTPRRDIASRLSSQICCPFSSCLLQHSGLPSHHTSLYKLQLIERAVRSSSMEN
uniref:Uncharacterized protein n=1 Tax=Aegilops tauschii subsp. strangulata TaxID=200361 RepID=A0A453NR85_AEGTS